MLGLVARKAELLWSFGLRMGFDGMEWGSSMDGRTVADDGEPGVAPRFAACGAGDGGEGARGPDGFYVFREGGRDGGEAEGDGSEGRHV